MKTASNSISPLKPKFDGFLIEQLRTSEAESARVKKIVAKLQMLINEWGAKAHEFANEGEEAQARTFSHCASQVEVVLNKLLAK